MNSSTSLTASSPITFLVDQLERAHAGDPWHGSSRASILGDVTADEAREHPAPNVHSIWELVLHMTAWTNEVTRRVRGADAAEPEMGDWPALPARSDDAAWRASLAALDQAHVALRNTVRDLDASRLTKRVGDARNPPLGTGVTVEQTINGIVQHDAYHSGQIAILKKLIRSG